MCEIHAPFSSTFKNDSLLTIVKELTPVLDLAKDVGALIVTIHADLPASIKEESTLAWLDAMTSLNAKAAERGLIIGLEVVHGFDRIKQWHLSNIGVTLDVGHIYGMDGGVYLEPYGTIGEAIRHVGSTLVHLHMHDFDGNLDHIEIGTGNIDFDEIITALKDIGYQNGMCLELNPDRVSPEGIRRSKDYLEVSIAKVELR